MEDEKPRTRVNRNARVLKALAPFYDGITGGAFTAIMGRYWQDPISERLKKIDEAKAALSEALSAIEDLEAEAETNNRALAQLRSKLEDAQKERTAVSGEVQALKSLAEIDAEAVRKALRLPTQRSIWLGHFASFGLGIVGSVIASWLWYLTPWG